MKGKDGMEQIENINIQKLMKYIKAMIENEEFNISTEDYEIKLLKSDNVSNIEPLKKLLCTMVQENYIVTELYFENVEEFKKYFGHKYEENYNEIFHSIRIEEIKFAGEETYSGTLIYHEVYGGKLKFQLSCINYLTKFQKEILW